ncbi:MAG: AAA family ATPase, partial [Planctomycetaceae bacterium]|nr:AAA family ATPase [Planctomycetaceae bacterium]
MTLSERVSESVRACFTGLWIQSHEHQDAIAEIAALCQQESWRLATWNIASGLTVVGRPSTSVEEAGQDPLAVLRALPAMAGQDGTAILVLENFHRFLASPEIIQTLVRQILAGKQSRAFVVILAPIVAIPIELERLFVVIEHELPGREQLAEIARGIATEEGELPTGPDLDHVLDAAAGLTRYEAEGAFALAIARQGRLETEALWQLKGQTLLKGGLLSLHRGRESFAGLGGLDALKAFCLRALRRPAISTPVRARGILLLGVPGTGKSALAKSLGQETQRPTLILDVGALMGSLVGQTEERTRQALRTVDAMAPAILLIDEVEKALGGSGGANDSGVSTRMLGTLLTWLNDHESDVFVVCTANDVSRLPPEFSRAQRFDGIFFLDLPGRAQKDAIWRMAIASYGLDAEQRKPDDSQWTGAEIQACCRLAALLDMPLVQ